MVLGTPNHLPPEVLFGAPADARSDVWALGVVLYEMASAKFPFGGGTLPELANAIASETPAPLRGRVPIGIQAIIGRCLTKEPAKRFTNGGEVRAAIEALAQRDPRRAAGGAGRRIGMPVAAVLLGAIAVTFGVEGLRERITGAAGHPRIRSLAVLPLANLSGDPAQEYFADGMTEELITALAPIPSLKVISRTSIMRFKSTTQPIGDIAHTLGVDAIVEGSVLHAGNRVRITAQLIEASSDRHLWAKSFERDFRDVLALQSDVARDIASEIQLQVSPQVRARLASPRVVNPEAYELYLKGRFEWEKLTDASVRKAIEYFEHAHAIDPGDARYSSGMADAYLVLAQVVGSISPAEGMAKAKEYARRALEADENSAEAHASMGAALFFGDWNWREAERQLQRSIELNPGYSTARLVYSALLSASGRTEEAVQQDRRALESDPLSLIVNLNAVETLRLAGRFEQAIAQSRRAILANPDSPMSHGTLYKVYEAKGDFLAALDVLDRHLPEEAGGKAYIARLRKAYTESGASGYWRAVLDHALAQPDAKSLPAIQYAMAYARIGDRERALGYLKSAYEAHSGDLVFMNAEPCFTTLRDEPRFKAIARRVGIPAVAGS